MAADTGEESCSLIGRGNLNGVLLGGTTTAAPMDHYQSHAKERPTKKRTAQHIRCGIAEAATMY